MTDLPTLLSRATPGPWAVTEMKNSFCIHPADAPAGYQRRIADVIYWSQHHTGHKSNPLHADAEANAALIALAPQLAAALIEAMEGLAIFATPDQLAAYTLSRIDAIMNPGAPEKETDL